MNIKAMAAVVGLGFGGTVLALAAPDDQANEAPVVTEMPALKSEPVVAPVAAVEPIKKEAAARQEAKPAADDLTRGEWTRVGAAKPTATQQQLDALMAPVALYPDQLLSQILMASTYPLDVVEAARWRARPENQNLRGEPLNVALEDKDWDPSVKALVPFPEILKMMDSDLDWMSRVGDAFADQQAEVMDSVQRLRREARDADRLNSDNRRQVVMQDQQILIKPANPDIVYVPLYNPADAYGVWPYPDYPPAYIPPPVGYTYAPEVVYTYVNINPYWGWSRWDWNRRHIHIVDPPKWKHYHHGHDHVWRHDHSRDRRGRGPDRWRGHRPGQPGVNPNQPIVIEDGNFPHRRVPDGWDGNHGPRGIDAPPARPMRPQNPVYQRPPGTLPDMPPLPASAPLPAFAPPITNPNIGIQQPATEKVDTMRAIRPEDQEQWRYNQEQRQYRQQPAREPATQIPPHPPLNAAQDAYARAREVQNQQWQLRNQARIEQMQNRVNAIGASPSMPAPAPPGKWAGGAPQPQVQMPAMRAMPAREIAPPAPPQAAPVDSSPPQAATQTFQYGKPSAGGYCGGGARC